MKFTPETLNIHVRSTIVLEGIRSPLGTRYLDSERNNRNFQLVMNYLEGTEQSEKAKDLIPRINRELGELNDLRTGVKKVVEHQQHIPDASLYMVVTQRGTLARLIRGVREIRRNSGNF